jgi:serpin B
MKLVLPVLLLLGFVAADTTAFAETDSAVQKTAESYNAFGLKLLAKTRQTAPGRNVFISPAGVAFALSMVANGAQGETLRQILAALRLNARAPDLNGANQSLLDHLSNLDPKIKLEIANSVWTAQDAKINSTFLAVLSKSYHAQASNVDFTDPATAQKINDWCSDHTHGKIPKMVQPPLDANRLILLDAIYFKGDWTTPFDKSLTRDMPFIMDSGEAVTHPRMSRRGDFEYYENGEYQAVRLPYAGREVSMYLFLPRKRLDDFLQDLTLDDWQAKIKRLRVRNGTVELPRFKLENEYDLNSPLQALGITEAFTGHANFHGISDESLFISRVRQKTYVDVNEQGTVAAAVTGIEIHASVMRREDPPFQMVVDRPFFFALRENQSGEILFLGAILDPRQ